MEKWHKYKNYRKIESDGISTYIITVGHMDVQVSEDVYREYATSSRKMKYMELDLKCDRVLQDKNGKMVRDEKGCSVILPEREVSLNKLYDEGWDYPSAMPSPEDEVLDCLETKALHNCLDLLTSDEQSLINALFFEGMTEREYSKKSGIAQKTINDRKHRILGKLKNSLKNRY